jgi:hypothetical protein
MYILDSDFLVSASHSYRECKADFQKKAARLPLQVLQALRKRFISGRIDGRWYSASANCCGCFVGTAKYFFNEYGGDTEFPLVKDCSSPVERYFTFIEVGDIPEENPYLHAALIWLDEVIESKGG